MQASDDDGAGPRHARTASVVAAALAVAGMLCLLIAAVIADGRGREAARPGVAAAPP